MPIFVHEWACLFDDFSEKYIYHIVGGLIIE